MASNYILLENTIWKKVVYIIKFYLQFLCVAGYLKHSNDVSSLNIPKYTNCDIIGIYINRLSTANFHSDRLDDNNVREVALF